jgi:hypothetical protein
MDLNRQILREPAGLLVERPTSAARVGGHVAATHFGGNVELETSAERFTRGALPQLDNSHPDARSLHDAGRKKLSP